MQEARNNYLGLDIGTAKVGIALAHEETRVAVPYGIVLNNEQLLGMVGEILEKEEIGVVVIGIPAHTQHEGAYPGETFGKTVGDRFGVEVVYENEMFTTKMAQQSLKMTGEKGISHRDDAEAAKIILQSYIDKLPRK